MKKLESFVFTRQGNGGSAKHPWETYCDGGCYELDAEKDLFNASIRTFVVLLHRQAKKRGKRVKVQVAKDKKSLVIMAYVPETMAAESNADAAESNGKQPEQPKTTNAKKGNAKKGKAK